jgi:hypothetical protein
MIATAHIYAEGGRERLGLAQLEIACGEAFCDSCGDCIYCYGGEEWCPGGSHWWVLYEEDIAAWFGVELTPP